MNVEGCEVRGMDGNTSTKARRGGNGRQLGGKCVYAVVGCGAAAVSAVSLTVIL